MPLLCWHYTPSLWPWSLWTLSRTVSITTTRRRLLVTCVGGFACTEWELHNTEQRKSLWQRSAVWNENQFHAFSNGIILEHVVEDGEVAVFIYFLQTSISHISTLHNCCGSLITAPTLRFSAVPEDRSWPVRGAKASAFDLLPCWGHNGTLVQSPNLLSFCLREKIPLSHVLRPLGWDKQSITLHHRSYLFLSPVLLDHTTG